MIIETIERGMMQYYCLSYAQAERIGIIGYTQYRNGLVTVKTYPDNKVYKVGRLPDLSLEEDSTTTVLRYIAMKIGGGHESRA